MAIINILAFVVLGIFLSLYYKEKLVDVLPAAVCILILVLYPLAFVQRLSWIDGISLGFLAGTAVYVFCCTKEKRKALAKQAAACLKHPGVLAAVVLFAVTGLLVRDRIAVWWDDINFWATDVKSLWALDGFAAKYANAASEFGDYPPGLQLVKWWFVHMRPGSFSEGLMFAGYYFAVFVFCLPLLRHFKSRNPLAIVLAAVCIFAFPSVAEAFYCQGMCADLVMAVIYGAFLTALFDRKEHTDGFYYLRLALYLAVLVLIKSVGFLWAAFGVVCMWSWQLLQKNRRLWPFVWVTAAPALTGGSWLVFCLLFRRVAKLTGAAVSIAAGNLPLFLPGTREKLLAAFAEAFVCWPLHRSRTFALDFSPLALFCLICVLVAVLYRIRLLTGREAAFWGIFLPVSGLVFYSVNLVSHLTIFAAETQYLDPFAMVSSIERYGVPFTIGSLYLLAFILLERGQETKRLATTKAYLICSVFVLLSANWPEVYRAVWGYREQLAQDLQERENMISPQADIFLEKMGILEEKSGVRILYMKDIEANQWVQNTYLAYEASPVSLVFGSVNPGLMNSGDIYQALEGSHAGYLYTDELGEEGAALFAPLYEAFEPGVLYRIVKENGQLRLELP